jgi:hypothetical protein
MPADSPPKRARRGRPVRETSTRGQRSHLLNELPIRFAVHGQARQRCRGQLVDGRAGVLDAFLRGGMGGEELLERAGLSLALGEQRFEERDQPDRVDAGGDGLLGIRSPTGEVANWVVEAKTQFRLAERYLRSLAASAPERVLLVSPYLGPAIRSRCEEADVDYLDLTGWCRLRADVPAIFVRSFVAAIGT